MRYIFSFFALFFFTQFFPLSSDINPDVLKNRWDAFWIAHPTAPAEEFGVYHFRKTLTFDAVPDSFVLHVSADNRYRLYVNRRSVCTGPSRWDLNHWRFETVDISSFLKPGENIIAAVVWNFGEHKPVAQISHRSAFIVQGNSEKETVVNTNETWKVLENISYEPIPVTPATIKNYIAVGPGEKIDGEKYPWGWLKIDYDDSQWQNPLLIDFGKPRGFHNANTYWLLTPRQIPEMDEVQQRFKKIRYAKGIKADESFLRGENALEVPPFSSVSILLDQTFLTTAYAELLVSGGKGAQIKLSYAEAMVNEDLQKGHRDDVENRMLWGYYDHFLLEGGEQRFYSPLWFRTFRYVQMDVETKDEPLTVHDFFSYYTGYPFKENATFQASDLSLQKIWDVGWRTARLCAGETYFDCPYYEQLQYVGDTRIQALISLYVSGDDRLMRKAIQLFNDSRTPDGLTSSRYPTNLPQVIPPYSLFWVAMIYDYWMFRQDDQFVKSFLFGIQGVLDWYEQRIDDTGMLGPMEWWNFVDWPDEWAWDAVKDIGGVPAGASDGHSSIITMQYIYVLNMAAQLMQTYGHTQMSSHYKDVANSLKRAVKENCWDNERKLFADSPLKKEYSQHANVTAVLVDLVLKKEEKEFLKRIIEDKKLIQCTFYYRFYLVQAMKKAGLADMYLDTLTPWHHMLDLGLTTFAERQEPTRSDCHAWSASPNYDFLATVCGIEPAEPGFKSVKIAPALGYLEWVKGSLPHPKGKIKVDLKRKGVNGLEGTVVLPEGLSGTFFWKGTELKLTSGMRKIQF